MLTPEPVVLSRGRVVLEPWAPEHDAALFEAAQHDDVWQWMPVPRPADVQDLLRFRSRVGGFSFVVIVDGVVRGTTSYLDIDTSVGGIEIGGTWYSPDVWASDVNPTCKLLLMTQAFEVLGAERVTLKTDGFNTRSQAAIKKLGCRYDGTLRHNRLRADGSVRDTVYFSMLRSEWPPAKEGLLARLA